MGALESVFENKYELTDFQKEKLLHEFRSFYGKFFLLF